MEHKARGRCRAGERFISSEKFGKLWSVDYAASALQGCVRAIICRRKMRGLVPGVDSKNRDGKRISAPPAHPREVVTRTLSRSSWRLLGS